jgi:Flp pilus assembly pilin Flp
MNATFFALLNDENGFIVSAELILIVTISVLALVVGMSEVAVAVNTELNDISNAFGSLNQSFSFSGFCANGNGKPKSMMAGTCFMDQVDDCDRNQSCDIVMGANQSGGEGGHM